jgi:hypothetical protein
MALIQCPECGENVSSTSNVCIHCGFELSGYIKENVYYDLVLKSEKVLISNWVGPLSLMRDTCKVPEYQAINLLETPGSTLLKGLTWKTAQHMVFLFGKDDCEVEPVATEDEYRWPFNDKFDAAYDRVFGPVRCPRCHSEQVTTGKRGFSMITGFIGSGATVNRCAKCGHRWKP